MENQQKEFIVYAITLNGVPGKVYIGTTSKQRSTFTEYASNITNKAKNQTHMIHGIRKMKEVYAANNLSEADICFHVLYRDLTKLEAVGLKEKMIEKYKSNDPEYGWNYTTASGLPDIHVYKVDDDMPPVPLPKSEQLAIAGTRTKRTYRPRKK